MKNFILLAFSSLLLSAFSYTNQSNTINKVEKHPKIAVDSIIDQGIVTYKRVVNWKKIAKSLSHLSQEEKDRIELTWGNSDGWGQNFELRFSPMKSSYFLSEEQAERRQNSWRQSDLYLSRNFDENTRTEWIETMGRTYLIEDVLEFPKWKILNEMKEVAGYICLKAETRDTVKNQVIHAWFTDQIPAQAGPEFYCGLPGLIMELDVNDGAMTVTAHKVKLQVVEDFKKPKKMKGKKVDWTGYQNKIKSHISNAIEGERNPYWSLRY